MLFTDPQKHASTPSSVAPPTYHASVYDIPRRDHGGSAPSTTTTAAPARCRMHAIADPTSSQPTTMIERRPCCRLVSVIIAFVVGTNAMFGREGYMVMTAQLRHAPAPRERLASR
jgi:hypothetical protein